LLQNNNVHLDSE